MQQNELSRYIDHTLLTSTATVSDITLLCREAITYSFYAVCVHAYWLPHCRQLLAGTPVKTAAVIDFPHGAGLGDARRHAAAGAVAAGADELDVVVSLPAVMAADWAAVTADIKNIVRAADANTVIKVILEGGLLSADALTATAESVLAGGAHFLKTATGMGPGATPTMVAHLHRLAHPRAQVKAAGGIRTAEQARALLAAGATRLGTSRGIQLVTSPPVR